jgi:hypothetical protein
VQEVARSEQQLDEAIQAEKSPAAVWELPVPLMRTAQSMAEEICLSELSNARERTQAQLSNGETAASRRATRPRSTSEVDSCV